MADQAKDRVRLTANISPDVADALKSLADEQGVTITEALRRAISTEKYLKDKVEGGAKVLVEEGGKLKELVFINQSIGGKRK